MLYAFKHADSLLQIIHKPAQQLNVFYFNEKNMSNYNLPNEHKNMKSNIECFAIRCSAKTGFLSENDVRLLNDVRF